MIIPTHDQTATKRSRSAFTLVELILVMILMVVVASLVAPSLGSFFRGRSLDSEARRLVSLTHYGQSRAVSDGVPVVLWIDAKQRAYGLVQEATYATVDTKSVQYTLADDLEIDTGITTVNPARVIPQTMDGIRPGRDAVVIRFKPDGFMEEGGPSQVWLNEKARPGEPKRDGIWITPTQDGSSYEIQTNYTASVRR